MSTYQVASCHFQQLPGVRMRSRHELVERASRHWEKPIEASASQQHCAQHENISLRVAILTTFDLQTVVCSVTAAAVDTNVAQV